MTSTIRNLTRYSPGDPPKWTTLDYEHPMTEEWSQHLRTKDSATRLQKLKDATITLYRQLALKAEEEKKANKKSVARTSHRTRTPSRSFTWGKTIERKANSQGSSQRGRRKRLAP